VNGETAEKFSASNSHAQDDRLWASHQEETKVGQLCLKTAAINEQYSAMVATFNRTNVEGRQIGRGCWLCIYGLYLCMRLNTKEVTQWKSFSHHTNTNVFVKVYPQSRNATGSPVKSATYRAGSWKQIFSQDER